MSEPLTPEREAWMRRLCLAAENEHYHRVLFRAADVRELTAELDRLRDELRQLREVASVAVKFMEPTGAQLAAVYGHDQGCICEKCEHVDQACIAREELRAALLPAKGAAK